jgi:hypothetical protein
VFVFLLSVLDALSEQPKNQSPKGDQNTHSSVNGSSGLTGIVGFIDRNRDDINATSTLAIAALTLALVIVGYVQAKRIQQTIETMDDTAERQLRAYVWFTVSPTRPLMPTIIMRGVIKNTGQTPAYETCFWANTEVFSHPLPVGQVFSTAPPIIDAPRYVVNPGSEHFSDNTSDTPLTEEQMASIMNGTMRLYSWGEIRYIDAFKKERYSRFKLYWQRAEGPLYGTWVYCDDGNTAS